MEARGKTEELCEAVTLLIWGGGSDRRGRGGICGVHLFCLTVRLDY